MKKLIILIVVLIVVMTGLFFMFKKDVSNPVVILKTNKGNIIIELFLDKIPKTAGNFIELAQKEFFDGTKFHRVIQGFVIQGGDPNSKGDDKISYGRGGPGYNIEDEFISGFSNVRGTISMANTGQPNSGGSQFFINLADNIGLDFDKPPEVSRHPVFGKVTSGMEVVNKIAQVQVDEMGIPIEPVIIENVFIAGLPVINGLLRGEG